MELLFIEVDNCHETAEELAAKLEKYARFFRRTVKDTDGKERPMWRTRWAVSENEYGEVPHPPVLVVFNHIGERNPNRTIPRLHELTRHLWKGQWLPEGYHSYDGKIPSVAAGLMNLREHGPIGPVFLRFGRGCPSQSWTRSATPASRQPTPARRKRPGSGQAEYQAQLRKAAQEHTAKKAVEAAREAAQRQARRPSCAGCRNRFTDERWEAAEETDWGRPVDTHPTLCDTCKHRAVTAAQERQEPARGEAVPDGDWPPPQRPVCGAAFTDERWRATARVAGILSQEKRPSLCRDCDLQFESDLDQAWGVSRRREKHDQEQEQGSAVPRPKSGLRS
ncbi:hypothetical protein HFP43_32215 [Streptomyces sp. SJ1-7]|nr:hypothetical protein [Streptomyces sp. SJ1-7]